MARSSYDALLSDSWRTLHFGNPAPNRPMTLMDVALGRSSIADMCFGRFVQTPTWDATVPAALPPADDDHAPTAAVSGTLTEGLLSVNLVVGRSCRLACSVGGAVNIGASCVRGPLYYHGFPQLDS